MASQLAQHQVPNAKPFCQGRECESEGELQEQSFQFQKLKAATEILDCLEGSGASLQGEGKHSVEIIASGRNLPRQEASLGFRAVLQSDHTYWVRSLPVQPLP